VQRLRRLLRQRTIRHQDRRFVLEGAHLLEAALDASASLEAVFFDPSASLPGLDALLERARAAGARVFGLRPGVLERVSDTVTPQPVCAIAAACDVGVEELVSSSLEGAVPLVVCVGVRDPGNLGAILRSAEAAGSAGVLVCGESADLFNPKVVRASAGAVFRLPLAVGGDATEVLDRLGEAGVRRIGTLVRGGSDYALVSFRAPVALVFGNEASGLGPELSSHLDEAVTIPMAGRAESLNVAMAVTVLCFEAARRRRAGEGAVGNHLR
jgi:TrmH family RNA methyltransferase